MLRETRTMKQVQTVLLMSVAVLAVQSTASAQFEDLLRRIPRAANALVVIDVTAVHASELAKRDGWKRKHEATFSERPIMLPPETDKIVLAAQLNPTRNFEEAWELAVMHLTDTLSMRSIARAEGGYVDTINGLQAAWTPSEAYFVGLEPKTVGVMYPANRQLVSRWADFSRQNQVVEISAYLQKATKSVDQTAQIVMALDLKDVVQPHKVRQGLEDSQLLKGNERKIDQLAALLPTIQGVTLTVRLGRTARGTLSVDFAESSAPFANFAKPIVLYALDKFEVHLEDLEQWNVELEGNSLVMEGALSTNGMRRIFSLLEIPTTKFSTLKDVPPTPGSTESVAKASQTYFKSVVVLIDDLQSTLKRTRDNHAVWMERYGQKIDRLPILNVDENLLEYGAKVAETFRAMSVAERTSNVRSGVRKSQVYGNYSYQHNGHGYYGARKTSGVRTQIKREEDARASAVRFNSWKEVEDATFQIRKQMTGRYKVEF